MRSLNPKIIYLTAGAANMYCGSCLRDNTLAAALRKLDCDIQLFPTYTPTRTDEENVSEDHVLLGGVNLYLQQKFALFRNLPPTFDRWLNNSRIIRRLASNNLATTGHEVGRMTVSLLKGESGNQRKEFERMVHWMSENLRPDLIHLTNILLAGSVPLLKKHFDVPVLVTLQGEDLFLEETPEPHKSQAIDQIRRLVKEIDGFIVFNRYYADFMSDYLNIPPRKINIASPGIRLDDFVCAPAAATNNSLTVGYLARICPEKGFHLLVDAFIRLREMAETANVKLRVAGWMSSSQESFFEDQINKLKKHNLYDDFEYSGTVDRQEKIRFLSGLDVFSVPTTYAEPNGIYALEALAAGVPMVQPRHGMFPELLESTNGGLLINPNSAEALANGLHRVLSDPSLRKALARRGQASVFRSFHAEAMARSVLDIYESHIDATRKIPTLTDYECYLGSDRKLEMRDK